MRRHLFIFLLKLVLCVFPILSFSANLAHAAPACRTINGTEVEAADPSAVPSGQLTTISPADAAELLRGGYVLRNPLFLDASFADQMPAEIDRLIDAGVLKAPAVRIIDGQPTEYSIHLGPWTQQFPDSALIREMYNRSKEFVASFNTHFPENPLNPETIELQINRVHAGWTGLERHVDISRVPYEIRGGISADRHAFVDQRLFTLSGYFRPRTHPEPNFGQIVFYRGRESIMIPTAHGSGAFFLSTTPHEVLPIPPEAVDTVRYSFQVFAHAANYTPANPRAHIIRPGRSN